MPSISTTDCNFDINETTPLTSEHHDTLESPDYIPLTGQFQLKLIEAPTNEDIQRIELTDEAGNMINLTKVTADQGKPKQMKKKTILEIVKPKIELTGLDEITHDVRNNDHPTQDLEPCQSRTAQPEFNEKGGLESSDDTSIQRTKSTSKLSKITLN